MTTPQQAELATRPNLTLSPDYLRVFNAEWARIAEEPLTLEFGAQEADQLSINAFGSAVACRRLARHLRGGVVRFSAERDSWRFQTTLEALVGLLPTNDSARELAK